MVLEKCEPMTVNELVDYLTVLKNGGAGEFKIKIGDNYLYDEELGVVHDKKEVSMRGFLFCEDTYQIAKKFVKTVNEAFDKMCREV